jgi:hypothetical protein
MCRTPLGVILASQFKREGNMTVELIDVERFAEADRIPEVLRRLASTQIAAEKHPRARHDGLACFNYLYTVITNQVQDDYVAGKFASGDFITRLDVAFANRYLGAVDAAGDSAPRPWRSLLEMRSDAGISPLAFAVAGVSAHVNFDLAFAVLETALQRDRLTDADHDDYQLLNKIFFREMRKLRIHFEDGTERWVERTFGLTRLENVLGDIIVVVSRYIAWLKAVHLWDGRADTKANALEERGEARTVGALNRALLVIDRDLRAASAALLGRARQVSDSKRRPGSEVGRP